MQLVYEALGWTSSFCCLSSLAHQFHLSLPPPTPGDKLVQLVYEALDAATQTETAHQEELAAKRALDKAHVKVRRLLSVRLLLLVRC